MKQISQPQMGRVTKNERGVIHNYAEAEDVNWPCSMQNGRNSHRKNLVHLGSLLIAITWPYFAHLFSFNLGGLQSKSLSPESGQDTRPMSTESAGETEKHAHSVLGGWMHLHPLWLPGEHPHASLLAWRLHYEMLPQRPFAFLSNTCPSNKYLL